MTMQWLIRRASPLLLAVVVLGCGDFSLQPDPAPDRIVVTPDTLQVVAGRSARLSLEALDASGAPLNRIPSWVDRSWAVSPAERVSIAGNEVEGLSPGVAKASVSVGDLTSSVTVLVNPSALKLEVAAAYLTQATQHPDGSVPLVAGRDALLRVFLRGDVPSYFRPTVHATVYGDGGSRSFTLEREALGVPLEVQQEFLESSWNTTIPGSEIVPGAELVIEADPAGLVPRAPESTDRLPTVGRMALDVIQVPPLSLRYVRVHLSHHGTTGTLDPSNPADFSREIYEQFPIDQLDVDLRVDTWTSDVSLYHDGGWTDLLREIELLRHLDESDRYYYGVVRAPPGIPVAGVGYIGYPVAVGVDDSPGTAAHELGHNFGLPHAPCGGPSDPDPDYPYANGSIGAFGYSVSRQVLFDPANTRDLMSYCRPRWVSDYNFLKVIDFRDRRDNGSDGLEQRRADVEDVLLVWGGIRDGRPVLEPAFRLQAPAALPESGGPYSVEAYDHAGVQIFALAFDGRRIDHSPGDEQFLFAVPLSPDDFDRIHRIRLTGPDGTTERIRREGSTPRHRVVLERRAVDAQVTWSAADYPAALVRDAETGTPLGLVRDGRLRPGQQRPGVELLLSDGVRTIPAKVD